MNDLTSDTDVLDGLDDGEGNLDGGTGPEPSLRDELEAQVSEASDDDESEETPGREYTRDEIGRFAARKAKEDAAAEAAGEEVQVPKSWSAEKAELYKAASPELREYINQREAEVGQGFASRAEQLQQYQSRVEPVMQSLKPLDGMLAQSGVSHAEYVSGLVKADQFIRQNPQQAIQHIARQANIDLDELAFMPAPEAPNPELMALRQQVQQTRQQMEAWQNQASQSYEQQVADQIQTFQAEASETGEPLHPHFEAVKPLMASLLQTGQAEGLQDAYDMAVYAHPQVRESVISSNPAVVEATTAAKQRAAAAKSTSIRGTPSAGVSIADQPANSLREEISKAFSAGSSRV